MKLAIYPLLLTSPRDVTAFHIKNVQFEQHVVVVVLIPFASTMPHLSIGTVDGGHHALCRIDVLLESVLTGLLYSSCH